MTRGDERDRVAEPAEPAVWAGRARSLPILVVGVLPATGLAAAALASGTDAAPGVLATGLVVAVAFIWLSHVRVSVAAAGVRVGFGPFGAPARFLALEEIASAEAIDVKPLLWGGWGYRLSPRGHERMIVRGGPGLVVLRSNGRRFTVTVDGAPQAAGLVNDLLARRA